MFLYYYHKVFLLGNVLNGNVMVSFSCNTNCIWNHFINSLHEFFSTHHQTWSPPRLRHVFRDYWSLREWCVILTLFLLKALKIHLKYPFTLYIDSICIKNAERWHNSWLTQTELVGFLFHIKKDHAIHPKHQPQVYLVVLGTSVLLWKCEHLWAQVYDYGENISWIMLLGWVVTIKERGKGSACVAVPLPLACEQLMSISGSGRAWLGDVPEPEWGGLRSTNFLLLGQARAGRMRGSFLQVFLSVSASLPASLWERYSQGVFLRAWKCLRSFLCLRAFSYVFSEVLSATLK